MINITAEQLEGVVNEVFSTVFQSEPRSASDSNKLSSTPGLGGVIRITGAWNGGIVVQTTEKHLLDLAAVIFGKELSEVEPSEARDVVGEIANMIGGHVKAMIPDACNLSLPSVQDNASLTSTGIAGDILMTLNLESNNEPVKVVLFQDA